MAPSTKSITRVLVTGATGYVGAAVADQFLQAGYVVIGTSRTAAKAESLKKFFDNKYGPGKFEIYEADDLETEGVFDGAVKDVEAIAHVASPVVFNAEDPIRDVINPAINGTLSLLNSAHKYGKNVKHVVITSSIAAINTYQPKPGHIYAENDWNDIAYMNVLKLKESAAPIEGFPAYWASKNEAERAVWRFKEEKNPLFTISTILPAYVFGTVLPPPQSLDDINAGSSYNLVISFFNGTAKDPTLTFEPEEFVDVGDVARAHVLAIEKADVADGQRYLLSAGPYEFQQVVDILRKNFPEQKNIIVEGNPGQYKKLPLIYDASKVTRDLGIQYKSLENVVLDTVNSVKHLY